MTYFKLLFYILLITFYSCNGQTKKINGVSFVASPHPITVTHVKPVININANYATVMPFGFIKSLANPNISFNSNRQWFGETSNGIKQYVNELRKQNLKIMLKPQIWVWNGEYTGFIKMNSETDWEQLEIAYSKFILEYATLAQSLKLEIFCMGTELEQFVVNRPKYWQQLIQKIKTIYKGKLTYAANWDEFKRTPFWKTMDYIGIDAYFPVSEAKTPSIKSCLNGWEPHFKTIKAMAKKYNKLVLFTEFGYRSVDYSGREPWKSDRSMNQINLEAQNNTTKALFKTFWKEDWFAGGFIWKWFRDYEKSGGPTNSQFTPQNKPVEQIIKHHYK